MLEASGTGKTEVVQDLLCRYKLDPNEIEAASFIKDYMNMDDSDNKSFVDKAHDARDKHYQLQQKPVVRAILGGHVDTASLLLKAGAVPNAYDGPLGLSALDAALKAPKDSSLPMLGLLLSYEIDVHMKYELLFDAALTGNAPVVELLLEKGGLEAEPPYGRFKRKYTPLMLAGHTKVMEVLMRWGADPNAEHAI